MYKNRDWLYQKYWVEELSLLKISKMTDASLKTIQRQMIKFNIPRRTHKGKDNPMYGRTGKNHPLYGIGFMKGKHHSEKTKRKMSELKAGKNHPNWKGGIKKNRGYIFIWKPDHPGADGNGYTKRARLVAEKTLGRYLYSWEITHHENEIRDDDRSENIKVTTQSKHMSLHHRNRGKYRELLSI